MPETWQELTKLQWRVYGATWVKHLELLNIEIKSASKNVETLHPSLIPYYWNDPPVTKTRDDDGKPYYPLISARASTRTAAMLARGWLLKPRTVTPEDHIQVNQSTDPREANIQAILAVLLNEIDVRNLPDRSKKAWEQVLRTMDPTAVERFTVTLPGDVLPTKWLDALSISDGADVEEIVPSGSARSRWMNASIGPNLAVRIRARALVDAYAFDTMDKAGKGWTPRVLLHFPNAPSPDVPAPDPWATRYTPAQWKAAVEYRSERLRLHDNWLVCFIGDLEEAGLTVEAQIVEDLRNSRQKQVRQVLQGAPSVNEGAESSIYSELDELLELRRAVVNLWETGADSVRPSVVFRNAAAIVGDAFRRGPGHAAKCVLDWFDEHLQEEEPTNLPTAYTELSVDRRCTARCLIDGVIWSVVHGFEDGNQ